MSGVRPENPGTKAADSVSAVRWVEFLALFVGLPLGLALLAPGKPVLPALWIATAVIGVVLAFDRTFDRGAFAASRLRAADGRRLLVRWAVAAVALTGILLLAKPEYLLQLPRERPVVWALVMVLYPLLSVVPQAIVYRAFLFHRYGGLFPSPRARLAAAAFAFGFAHIVFLNPWALAFTLAGGWLFAGTYVRTGSLWASAVEHALYGCFLMTVGWGRFFYHGSIATAGAWAGK